MGCHKLQADCRGCYFVIFKEFAETTGPSLDDDEMLDIIFKLSWNKEDTVTGLISFLLVTKVSWQPCMTLFIHEDKVLSTHIIMCWL